MQPQQLAKILRTVAVVNPSEYGLFWDKDGSMPWKEFFWALQREEDLRFVRESHIREIELAGIDLPFRLEEGRLKLKEPLPIYPAVFVDKYLYIAVPLRGVPFVKTKGILIPSNRSYIALWTMPDESLRMAKPSTVDKYVVVTVDPEKLPGHSFYQAGEKLFLTDQAIPPHALIMPFVSEKELDEIREARKEKAQKAQKEKISSTRSADISGIHGSFILTVEAFQKEFGVTSEESDRKSQKKKRSKGPDWKREARKIRKTKRTV